MHNCDHIKELLLSDHADGRLDVKTLSVVEAHLKTCVDCRQLAFELKEHVRYPLMISSRQELPEEVWLNIRQKITAKTDAKTGFLDTISSWVSRLSLPRLVPVLGAFAAAVVIVSSVLTAPFAVKTPQVSLTEDTEESQLLLLTSVSTDLMNDAGTPIERYFL